MRGAPVIVGVFEHPGRELPGYTVPRLLQEVACGALDDAGLSLADVDGFFCDSTVPGRGPLSMVDYLGLQVSHVESSDFGGGTYVAYLGHAVAAIEAGRCKVALIVQGGLVRGRPPVESGGLQLGRRPELDFDQVGLNRPVVGYAMVAKRHMYDHGTTPEQFAWVKATASEHALANPNAFLRKRITVDDVLASPLIADPLHRDDCCVVTDGGGALVVVHPDVAATLKRRGAAIVGHAESIKTTAAGAVDVGYTAAVDTGARAFAMAGANPADVQYASIYDSFTSTVVITLEDLGFCERGEGGHFVMDGGLRSPGGRLPVNSDGGGLCNNHPGGRGGVTKVIEAVRQVRGEATPAVQVPDCEIAVAHGSGGILATTHLSSTAVLRSFG